MNVFVITTHRRIIAPGNGDTNIIQTQKVVKHIPPKIFNKLFPTADPDTRFIMLRPRKTLGGDKVIIKIIVTKIVIDDDLKFAFKDMWRKNFNDGAPVALIDTDDDD